jgi:hypothetical protein
MCSTITFADFVFEGSENVEVVEMSDSKSDFLSRIGLHKSCRQNTLLFRAMMVRVLCACLPSHAFADIYRTKQELGESDFSAAGHVSFPMP